MAGRHDRRRAGYPPSKTDPNDELSSVADPGPADESDQDAGGDLSYDEVHQADEGGPGVPGETADSVAAQGGPPD